MQLRSVDETIVAEGNPLKPGHRHSETASIARIDDFQLHLRQQWNLKYEDPHVETQFLEYTFRPGGPWFPFACAVAVAVASVATTNINYQADVLHDSPSTYFFSEASWHRKGTEAPLAIYAAVGGIAACIAAYIFIKVKMMSRTFTGAELEILLVSLTTVIQATHISANWRYFEWCRDGKYSVLMRDPPVVAKCDDFIDAHLILSITGAFILPVRWVLAVPLVYLWCPIPFLFRSALGMPSFRVSDALWLPNVLIFVLPMIAADVTMRRQFVQHERVAHETREIAHARQAVDRLLSAMLPAAVLRRVIRGERIADTGVVSVVFSDVACFTQWCRRQPARTVVAMLNSMYTLFDSGLRRFGVEKVKTVGDAYWAVCGLPSADAEHAPRACAFAMYMLRCMRVMAERDASHRVQLRVGVHTGVACGGFVGTQQSTYDVFGTTHEVAEAMEQRAPVDSVLISAAARAALGEHGLVGAEADGTCVLEQQDEEAETAEGPTATYVLRSFLWMPAASGRGNARRATSSVAGISDSHAFSLSSEDRLHVDELDSDILANWSLFNDIGNAPAAAAAAGGVARGVLRAALLAANPLESVSGGSLGTSSAPASDRPASELSLPAASLGDGPAVDVRRTSEPSVVRERDAAVAVAELQARWGACSRRVLHTFDDTAVEAEFTCWASARFPRRLRLANCLLALLTALIHAVMLGEGHAHPWYTHVLLALVLAASLAMLAAAPRLHPYAGLAAFYTQANTLLIALIVAGRSVATLDLMYLSYNFTLISLSAGNVGGVSYLTVTATHFTFLFVPQVVAQGVLKTIYVHYLLVPGSLILCWLIGLRRAEVDSRKQFLNQKAAEHALSLLVDEHTKVSALLARMVPDFIVRELTAWFCGPRTTHMAAHVELLGVLFMRVPSFRDDLRAADAVRVMNLIGEYVAVCDGVLNAYRAHVTKLKVIGDVLMAASGLGQQHSAGWARDPDLGAAAVSVVEVHRRGAVGSGDTPSSTSGPLSDDGEYDAETAAERVAAAARTVGHRTHLQALALATIELADAVKSRLRRSAVCGLHCGPGTAGIIGNDRLLYDVFGDACNVASRVMTSASDGVWASALMAEAVALQAGEVISVVESARKPMKGVGILEVMRLVRHPNRGAPPNV